MLKDRRVLIEQEIKKAHNQAANMYLDIVVSGTDDDAHSPEYQALKDKIISLQVDLDVINTLISKGYE